MLGLEFFIIFLVAFCVLGPKRLEETLFFAGKLYKTALGLWNKVQKEVDLQMKEAALSHNIERAKAAEVSEGDKNKGTTQKGLKKPLEEQV